MKNKPVVVAPKNLQWAFLTIQRKEMCIFTIDFFLFLEHLFAFQAQYSDFNNSSTQL